MRCSRTRRAGRGVLRFHRPSSDFAFRPPPHPSPCTASLHLRMAWGEGGERQADTYLNTSPEVCGLRPEKNATSP